MGTIVERLFDVSKLSPHGVGIFCVCLASENSGAGMIRRGRVLMKDAQDSKGKLQCCDKSDFYQNKQKEAVTCTFSDVIDDYI